MSLPERPRAVPVQARRAPGVFARFSICWIRSPRTFLQVFLRLEHDAQGAVDGRRVGADTRQILASVVRTARQRQLDPRALFTTMLCAPEPVVPEALALPPPA